MKIHNTRSHVLDILQSEEAFTLEEYKHTHTQKCQMFEQLLDCISRPLFSLIVQFCCIMVEGSLITFFLKTCVQISPFQVIALSSKHTTDFPLYFPYILQI